MTLAPPPPPPLPPARKRTAGSRSVFSQRHHRDVSSLLRGFSSPLFWFSRIPHAEWFRCLIDKDATNLSPSGWSSRWSCSRGQTRNSGQCGTFGGPSWRLPAGPTSRPHYTRTALRCRLGNRPCLVRLRISWTAREQVRGTRFCGCSRSDWQPAAPPAGGCLQRCLPRRFGPNLREGTGWMDK